MSKVNLRKQVSSYFNLSELKDLCFDLGIEYENIPGDTLDDKSREIIKHCERNGLTKKLIDKCKQIKPFLNWVEFERLVVSQDLDEIRNINSRTVNINVKQGDIISFYADVLALKFANNLFGADRAVAMSLNKTDKDIYDSIPKSENSRIFPSLGRVKADYVLFINVGELFLFDYEKIRRFARQTLVKLADNTELPIRHIAMTIHGVGYGLDEAEAFKAQLAGYLDAMEKGEFPNGLESITIVERDNDRVKRLNKVLSHSIIENPIPIPQAYNINSTFQQSIIQRSDSTLSVGRGSHRKPYVVVAMSDLDKNEEFDDIYYYGIKEPVNTAGYLCERVTLSASLNAEFEQGKLRIETASLVIAELSGKSADVYLTLGYALGKNRPTILLTRQNDEISPLNNINTPCLVYRRIRDLETKLKKELKSHVEE